jgi:serine/threonine protein kinase
LFAIIMGGSASIQTSKLSQFHKQSPLSPEKYDFGDVIGKGGSSLVRVARYKHSNAGVFAMKEVHSSDAMSEKNLGSLVNELNILKYLGDHSSIIKLHVAFHDKTTCYIGLAYAKGGALRHHINANTHFSEEQVAYLIRGVGLALNYLHSRGVIHRDVKPDNILLSGNGHPILADFGVAYMNRATVVPVCTSSSGTCRYLPPEIHTNSHRHSYHVDFWSLGITAYELLFLRKPFEKHCWRSLIYFCENHYRAMWDRLQIVNEDSTIQDHNLSADLPFAAKQVDWEELAHCTEAYRLSVMPYPAADVPLPADNSLPIDLQVPIPTFTAKGETVSESCVSMLHGLLDVRIPLRLGVGKQFYKFVCHEWFVKCGVQNFIDGVTAAPFVPNVDMVAAICKQSHMGKHVRCTETSFRTSFFCNSTPSPVALPDSIVQKMKLVEYLSPTFLCEEVEPSSETHMSSSRTSRSSSSGLLKHFEDDNLSIFDI